MISTFELRLKTKSWLHNEQKEIFLKIEPWLLFLMVGVEQSIFLKKLVANLKNHTRYPEVKINTVRTKDLSLC